MPRLTSCGPVVDPEHPLDGLDIDVCNVRPAFEASLAVGVREAELQTRLGWSGALLERDGATVTGTSTYAHMEWMASRPDFGRFVLEAVGRHTAASLGIVGLACKTAANLGEALERHGRFQALTNRTARYDALASGATLRIEETRFGEPTVGSMLISEYTVLVAVQLLRSLLGPDVPITALHSRRDHIPDAERIAWERFAGAPWVTGQAKSALSCPLELVARAVPTHDEELSNYFSRQLLRAIPDPQALDWVERVRLLLERRLADGTPTAHEVGRELGMSQRTLARRLAEEDETFGSLLAAVRQRRARVLLADATLSQAEVTFLLGYRDQASFHRAFKRWFGTTPAVYRETLHAEA